MRREPSELELAVEAFVRGFAVARSLTHPYLVERVGKLWRLADAPRRSASDYRNEEWVACAAEPGEVDAAARRHSRGKYIISAIVAGEGSQDALREEYKKLGYRLMVTEPLFVHPFKRILRLSSPARIERVTTAELAAKLGKASRSRAIPRACFADDGPLRQYVALWEDEGREEKIVGWVRSIPVGESTWVASVEVVQAHRRRGIGAAMLAHMLREDRALGFRRSVLTASHTGALLYPKVGYKQIGMLLAYVRRKGG